MPEVCVYTGDALAAYHFGASHPFGPRRHAAFITEMRHQKLDEKVCLREPVMAERSAIEAFHTKEYVDRVEALSLTGEGLLDQGDTPAFRGMYETTRYVAGSVLDAISKVMKGECRQAFVPIAGLHHARRDRAAGFCVFNDCGIAIEALRHEYGIQRVAYVDIDAHHGDGVFYSFEADVDLCLVDFHEDGHYLYPGSGAIEETGTGTAQGSKLNIPMPPEANDDLFHRFWPAAEAFIDRARPEFILLQCGVDSLAGDPITHLRYSEASHALATRQLKALANKHCGGRLVAMGGGGYQLDNIARGWCAVVAALVSDTA